MHLSPFDFRSDTPRCAVRCLKCGKWTETGQLDLDGPAYKAYYCPPCAEDASAAAEAAAREAGFGPWPDDAVTDAPDGCPRESQADRFGH